MRPFNDANQGVMSRQSAAASGQSWSRLLSSLHSRMHLLILIETQHLFEVVLTINTAVAVKYPFYHNF
jgi:hypothetical protein